MLHRYEKLVLPEYLDFIREHECLVCPDTHVDAAHVVARGWEEAKRCDVFSVPLCRRHHVEQEQIGNRKFSEKHYLDIWECVARFMAEYFKRETAKS